MYVSSGICVLIADDHPAVREGLAAIVGRQADMHVVALAANGREAVELFRQHRPDIALMDFRMPVMNGAAATRAIISEFPEASILIVSMDVNEGRAMALQAGAKGFCRKDAGRVPLLEAIRAIVRNAVATSPQAPNARSAMSPTMD